METEEVWKDIPGYEGIYCISNTARVKVQDRVIIVGGIGVKYKSKIITQTDDKGYSRVFLSKNKKGKSYAVHQLMAVTFLNHTINGHNLVIDHINGDRSDNREENLRIVTHRFNLTKGKRVCDDRVSSRYPGVCWHKLHNKWISNIALNGKLKHLGVFKNEIDAANAYEAALSKIAL